MSETEKKLAACFSNVFPMLTPDETASASTSTLPAWDSVAHITLLSSVAEEFGIELEMEDFDALVSYPLILHYLKGRSGGR